MPCAIYAGSTEDSEPIEHELICQGGLFDDREVVETQDQAS
jgi:hypothetical protein